LCNNISLISQYTTKSFPRRRESRIAMKKYFVYILASKRNGTLYIGMTNDVERRIYEHKVGISNGFTAKYGVKSLVYYETFDDPMSAIIREKRMKKWKRAWKIKLIEKANPNWEDLSKEWYHPNDFLPLP